MCCVALTFSLLQISQLHQPAAAYAAEDATADVASSKKLDVLSKGKQVMTAATVQQVQLQEPMAFCWSSVIWTRALQHKNLQVGDDRLAS